MTTSQWNEIRGAECNNIGKRYQKTVFDLLNAPTMWIIFFVKNILKNKQDLTT